MGRVRVYYQSHSSTCVCTAADGAILTADLHRLLQLLLARNYTVHASAVCGFPAAPHFRTHGSCRYVFLFPPGHRPLSDLFYKWSEIFKIFRTILYWNVWEIVIIVIAKVIKFVKCPEHWFSYCHNAGYRSTCVDVWLHLYGTIVVKMMLGCIVGVFALITAYAAIKYIQSFLTKSEFRHFFFMAMVISAGIVLLTVIGLTTAGM